MGEYTAPVIATFARIFAILRRLFRAPSVRMRRFAYSPYGIGHTNLREPGDTRGTAVGKKGRFRIMHPNAGGDA